MEINSTSTFTLVVGDSVNNTLMNSYQDGCLNIAQLAKPSAPGRDVTILNTNAAEDDLLSYGLSEDKGDWEESLKPGLISWTRRCQHDAPQTVL